MLLAGNHAPHVLVYLAASSSPHHPGTWYCSQHVPTIPVISALFAAELLSDANATAAEQFVEKMPLVCRSQLSRNCLPSPFQEVETLYRGPREG